MKGMSIITATWFMFTLTGISILACWALREIKTIWTKLNRQEEINTEIITKINEININGAVTRSTVERIETYLEAHDDR